MATLVLHIGMPKTATTFLQRKIFPKWNGENVSFLPKGEIQRRLKGGEFDGFRVGRGLSVGFARSPLFWEDCGDSFFRAILSDDLVPDKSVVLSFEGITDPNFFATPSLNMPRKDPYLLKLHLERVVDISHRLGVDKVKVILTFRRQAPWLGSLYAQQSDRVFSAGQKDFEAKVDYLLDQRYGYHIYGVWMNYFRIWQLLSGVVGGENVLFLPQEMLTAQQKDFVERCSSFVGYSGEEIQLDGVQPRDNKRSVSENSWKLRPYSLQENSAFAQGGVKNRILRKLKIPRVFNKEVTVTRELNERINLKFAHENSLLSHGLGINLADYGFHA